MYVIQNTETGRYVTCPGSERSYTTKLQEARTFPTRESAKRDCCENERIVSIKDVVTLMGGE